HRSAGEPRSNHEKQNYTKTEKTHLSCRVSCVSRVFRGSDPLSCRFRLRRPVTSVVNQGCLGSPRVSVAAALRRILCGELVLCRPQNVRGNDRLSDLCIHRAAHVNEQMDDRMSPSRQPPAMRTRRRCEDTPPYLRILPNTYPMGEGRPEILVLSTT